MLTYVRSARKVWCPIRNYPITAFPEERVRQKLLKELIEFDKTLQFFILVEVKTPNGRADIVIYDEQNKPFLIIELKAPNEILNEFTLKQVMKYWNTLQSPFVALSNGRHTEIYHVINGKPKLIAENNLITFLTKQDIKYPLHIPINRLPYDLSTYHRYVKYLVDIGYVSEKSDPIKQCWYAELQNAILAEKYIPTNRTLPIEIEGDFGTSYVAFKNASNGTWDGVHRNFRVKVRYKGTYTFRIAIMGSNSTIDDKVFGNRVGGTYLNIVMQKHNSSTYNLQLNLDKHMLILENSYRICHDGLKSRTKKENVIKTVNEYSPFLLDDGRVMLATLPISRSISANEFSLFIENLIVYSAARDRVK